MLAPAYDRRGRLAACVRIGDARSGQRNAAHTDAGLLLLAHVLDCERAWIVAHGDALLTQAQRERFEGMCRARATGMPLAYVLGSAGFYGREFAVDARVLVPRPETEHLVDEALAFVAGRNASRGEIAALDVGTGSGAIAVTLAAESARTIVDATDTSPGAIMRSRARTHANSESPIAAGSIVGRLAEPVAGAALRRDRGESGRMSRRRSRSRQSRTRSRSNRAKPSTAASTASTRIVALLPTLPRVLAPAGLVLLEAAPEQIPALAECAGRAFRGARVGVARDYGGRDRYVRVETAAFSADS